MTPLLALPLALALAAAPEGCPEPAAAAGPLGGWCAAVAARPRLALPSAEDRRALREVLERPELRRGRADTAGFRRLLAGLWARILELMGSAEAGRYASVGRLVFIAAGLTALLAALAAVRRRRAAARGAGGPDERLPGVLPPPDRSAALAEAALARGDLAGAVRHAFLSALAALEEAGRLPRDRALTNGELTARLSGGGEVAAEFVALGRAFDRAVYGGWPLEERLARESVARALRIRSAAEGRP